jgi:peptidoglycan L-alanyl-D-glutamate endopeptidase CwlK
VPIFSVLSEQRLATCDTRLQGLMREAIKYTDFTILCGHRSQEEQEDAVRRGVSKTRWPLSKHNAMPSKAVDVAPYPVDWKDTARFARLFGLIECIAKQQGVAVRWGGDWDRDGRTADETFIDMPHVELVEP